MTLRSTYDYIVLGATVPGVLFAAEKSRAGSSVLLTNQYGFPGGIVTETLNCHQEAPPKDGGALLEGLYRTIARDNLAPSVVNPESVKYALQQLLVTTDVDLYFHVIPKQITMTDPLAVTVSLLAKEGITSVRGKKVLDATDELSGAAILGLPVTSGERNVNLFITPPADERFLSFPKVRRSLKLNDGRYWLSLRIDSTDELFREDETHSLLDEFRMILERSGCRIQILPMGVHADVSAENGRALNGSFSTLDTLLGGRVHDTQQFVRAARIPAKLSLF
jgi:hypothetical protein